MAHMQAQITRKQTWVRVQTTLGTESLPVADLGLYVRNSEQSAQPLTDAEFERYKKAIWQYTDGEPESWENVEGFGARLSAPGYLDRTEWDVYDSEDEARKGLAENYDICADCLKDSDECECDPVLTLADIKTAVDEGKTVHWCNSGYRVVRDSLGQYMILHQNGSAIGLTHADCVTLNGKPEEFYIV